VCEICFAHHKPSTKGAIKKKRREKKREKKRKREQKRKREISQTLNLSLSPTKILLHLGIFGGENRRDSSCGCACRPWST
jgi:hypothetical protein